MEDGLEEMVNPSPPMCCVSCLNPCFSGRWSRSRQIERLIEFLIDVLILVLVEDGLEENFKKMSCKINKNGSLNPCFSGRWSRRTFGKISLVLEDVSLNPCFSGRWSRSLIHCLNKYANIVLSLNPCFSGRWSRSA